MIKALRITVDNTPYENITIYESHEHYKFNIPNLFEDSQFIFRCRDGLFVLPDYQIMVIHVHKRHISIPSECFRAKWIMLCSDISYGNCHIVPQSRWNDLGIPKLFRDFEQLVFISHEGLFITCDYNVRLIRCE